MIFGLDLLGAKRYGKVALQMSSPQTAIGAFDNTFGNFYPLAERLLDRGIPALRVHLFWADNHVYGPSYINKIKKLARDYEKLARAHIGQQVYISPFCEHNLPNPDVYLDVVQWEAPTCTVVNTPWKGAFSKKYTNEIHGTKKPPAKGPYIYSFDGLDCFNSDAEKYKAKHASAQIFFWWFPQCNGRMSTNDNTPRPQRKAWPDKKLCDSALYLQSARGPAKLSQKWLWKSHAEQKQPTGDTRANKPVLISPLKTQQIEVRNEAGKLIETLPLYGPFTDGRYRYYSSKWGMDLGDRISLHAKGRSYGVLNGGFRCGGFRD